LALINLISLYAIPALFLIILSTGLYKNVKVYDVFTEGAREGLTIVLKIIPSLVGLMVAVSVFRTSGALDIVTGLLRPVIRFLGIPDEVMPLVLLRPFSGSASLAMVTDILEKYGPDSFAGRVASTMMGSTETLFYTICVYFGSVGVKNVRYTLAAALIAEFVSVLVSVKICGIL
jgi:spore maturation protein B